MDRDQIKKFSSVFAESIEYGLANVDAAVDYAMQYGRGQPKETITRFVKMYVNDLTLDMGSRGLRAIEEMFALAKEKKIIDAEVAVEVL